MDAVAYVRELERRDEALATWLTVTEELLRRTRALVSDAQRVRLTLDRLPREQTAAAEAIRRAEADVEARRVALEQAEEALRDARRGDATEREAEAARRRRALERAHEELESARRRAADLERRAADADAEARRVDAAAHALAGELETAPRVAARWPGRPASGLDGLLAWGARATNALVLARGALNGERDAVVREANELAANVLGGTLAPSGVARIRDRVEQTLR